MKQHIDPNERSPAFLELVQAVIIEPILFSTQQQLYYCKVQIIFPRSTVDSTKVSRKKISATNTKRPLHNKNLYNEMSSLPSAESI